MSAQEIWCLLALVAAVLSALLALLGGLRLPPDPAAPSHHPVLIQHAATALLGACLACLAAALWIAL